MDFKKIYDKSKKPLEFFSNLGIISLVIGLILIYVPPMFEPSPAIKFSCLYTGTSTYDGSGHSFKYDSITFMLFNGGAASAHNLGLRVVFNPEFSMTSDNITFNYDKSSNCRIITPFNDSESSNSIALKCDFLDPEVGLNVGIPLSNNQKIYWIEHWSDELKYKRESIHCE